MDNLACVPLLTALFTALLALLLVAHPRLQRYIHCMGAVLYLGIALYLNWHIQQTGLIVLRIGGYPSGVAISFILDYFSCLMILATALPVLAVAFYSVADSTINKPTFFYPAFWFMVSGVTGAFSTGDLFNLYVWFEVMIIGSFAMMALSKETNRLQGTLYYVAINLLATLVMLLSIAFLYGLSGTLDMAYMAQWTHQDSTPFTPLYSCLAALMVAFAIKAALFPYYFWLPDSYYLTSVSAGGVFSGLLTKVGVYALIRIGTLFIPPHTYLMQILLVVSCLTMLGGVFGAMTDFHIRRLLSFHTVSQIGYTTLALAIGTPLALSAGIFYAIHNMLVKTNLFLISGVLSRCNGQTDLREMGGFFQQKTLLMILFLISAFSLAGLPVFSGFWAKYLIVQAMFASGFWLSAVVAIIVGFFTLFSMIKIWRFAFLQPAKHPMRVIFTREKFFLYPPILFLSALTLFVGLFPQVLYVPTQRAAHALMQPDCYLQTMAGVNQCKR